MEVKYEAVFGDQAMFDRNDAPDDCEIIGDCCYKVTNGDVKVWNFSEKKWCKSHRDSVLAFSMRRIIRTPTWSVADQKAGKLPAVGSKAVSVHGFCVVDILAVRNGCVVACNSDVIDSRPCVFTVDNFLEIFKPIETPEEKAARLRDEWCRECKSKLYPRGSDGFPERIYDALLSGDLPVPVKEQP